MKRVKMGVYEWIEKLPDVMATEVINTVLGISGEYDGETITVADGPTVINILRELFGERAFYTAYGDNDIVADDGQTLKIASTYSLWKNSKLTNILRAFAALQAEYNPLDNYNGYEKTEITYGKTTDTTYGKTDTTTHGKVNTLETDVYGYNSGEGGADSDKVTSSDSGTTAIAATGTDGVKEGGTETHELTKRGNLGVTTNFQMISGEWDLRARNYVIDVLRDFVNLYTCY